MLGSLDHEQVIPFALKDGGESRQPEQRMPVITEVQSMHHNAIGLANAAGRDCFFFM